MSQPPDHVRLNRVLWDGKAPEYAISGRRSWAEGGATLGGPRGRDAGTVEALAVRGDLEGAPAIVLAAQGHPALLGARISAQGSLR